MRTKTTPNNYRKFLEKVLPEIQEEVEDLEVLSVYGGAYLHLVLSPSDFVDKDDAGELTLEDVLDIQEPEEDDLRKIYDLYSTAIKNNPHIFGISNDDIPDITNWQPIYNRVAFELDESFHFTIKVPTNKKKYVHGADSTEQFEVIAKGSNNIAFVELNDCPKRISVGHEMREQMRYLVDAQEGQFKLGSVGPSPIHPIFYIINVSNPEYAERVIWTRELEIYIVVNFSQGGTNAREIYTEILERISIEMDEFYCLSKLRNFLLDLNYAIHQRLEQTVSSYMKLGSNIFFVKFGELAKLRLSLLNIHKGSLELELALSRYERARKSLLTQVGNNPFLANQFNYLDDVTEPDCSIGNALFKTLEYMEKSVSSYDVAIRTTFAAVIGATIGAYITYLI